MVIPLQEHTWEQSMNIVAGFSCARAVSQRLEVSYGTVWKVRERWCIVIHTTSATTASCLSPTGKPKWPFALNFLARTEVDESFGDSRSCAPTRHIFAPVKQWTRLVFAFGTRQTHVFHQIPLHSLAWRGFIETFMLGPLFFKETKLNGPDTCSMTAQTYQPMLHTFVVPQLQQQQCLEPSTFMQDGVHPHIACCVQQFLQ